MSITAVLKWQNQDATRDLNSRFQALFSRGVMDNGIIVPVSGSLEIDLQPFNVFSNDGMLVTSDSAERLTIPLDQTNIITLLARHNIGADPTLELKVVESSVFYGLIDREDHIIFGSVTTASPATEVAPTDISYALREEQDQRGRLILRGNVATVPELPSDPNFIKAGDCYVVAPGGGVTSDIYSWDGVNWINITATASISADLATHRANGFSNEKHLSDDQEDAALGSFGVPSLTNRYVTEVDTRLPTQDENNALQGSDGSPSNINRYLTEEYSVNAPTQRLFAVAPGASLLIPAIEGPVYVGTGGINSANQYFSILDYTLNRGYVNSLGLAPEVNGVYLDIFLSVPLDPSTDPGVDSEGFFSGSDIYISVDNLVDTQARLVYGKKETSKTVTKNYTITASPADEVIASKVIALVSNIKGRAFDDLVPTAEQNINLRSDLDGVSTYIGSVLNTNIVAANEDFIRLQDDPVLGGFFEKNIGIDSIYTYYNAALIGFVYNPSLGRITYGAPVSLAGVRIGDLFIDGAGNEFQITAVNDPGDYLDIVNIDDGLIPISVIASVGTAVDGSTKINYNPRELLLSEMKMSNGVEVIPVRSIARKDDEYSKPLGQVTHGLVKHDNRFEPRVAFFGGWENYTSPDREMYVRNVGVNGTIAITGFFTDVSLLIRRKDNSPPLSVSIDKQTPTIISTSATGTISSAIASSRGPRYHRLPIFNSGAANRPYHVEATIQTNTVGSLDVYGIELIRSDSASLAFLESGRAFESARIVSRDTVDAAVSIIQLGALERGGRLVYSVDDNSYNVTINELDDLDTGGTPSGVATGANIVIGAGLGQLASYKTNDYIIIRETPVTAISVDEIRRITGIAGTTVSVTPATSFSGTNVFIQHIASTDSNIPLTTQEDHIATYLLPNDFINHTVSDFETVGTRDRFVVGHDYMTVISARDALITETDVIGGRAVQVQSGGSAELRFFITCTRLDILAVNAAAATATVSIDGSPAYSFTFSGGERIRRTIFSNARYQTHEVVITPTSGNFSLSEIFLFGPQAISLSTFPNEVGDLSRIARYDPSTPNLLSAPNLYPKGAVFYEATTNLSYIEGTGTGNIWAIAEDYSKTPLGPYVYSDKEGAFIEFYFLGQAFELQYITGPDHGIFTVEVDGTALELAGGTIVGDYTGPTLNPECDGYSAAYSRRNIGAYGLTWGYHRVTAIIGTPRLQNPSATGYNMAFTGYWIGNDSGYESIGINREGVYTSVVDTRDFIPLEDEITEEVQVETDLERTARISLVSGTTSIAVTLSQPMPDLNYIITANLMNLTDSSPNFQPLLITAQSLTGFTISWNTPLASNNYELLYYVRSL